MVNGYVCECPESSFNIFMHCKKKKKKHRFLAPQCYDSIYSIVIWAQSKCLDVTIS